MPWSTPPADSITTGTTTPNIGIGTTIDTGAITAATVFTVTFGVIATTDIVTGISATIETGARVPTGSMVIATIGAATSICATR